MGLFSSYNRSLYLAGDEASASLVEGAGIDAGLGLERAWLHPRHLRVEVVSCLPILQRYRERGGREGGGRDCLSG
jgi:hypothetical protein